MSKDRLRSTPGRTNEGFAFQAASDLVFKGLAQPSGCTEPLLHGWRLKVKHGQTAQAAEASRCA